jgi:hypothetical protein
MTCCCRLRSPSIRQQGVLGVICIFILRAYWNVGVYILVVSWNGARRFGAYDRHHSPNPLKPFMVIVKHLALHGSVSALDPVSAWSRLLLPDLKYASDIWLRPEVSRIGSLLHSTAVARLGQPHIHLAFFGSYIDRIPHTLIHRRRTDVRVPVLPRKTSRKSHDAPSVGIRDNHRNNFNYASTITPPTRCR